MKNSCDHHDQQDINTYNLSGSKRFTLDVPNQSPTPLLLEMLAHLKTVKYDIEDILGVRNAIVCLKLVYPFPWEQEYNTSDVD